VSSFRFRSRLLFASCVIINLSACFPSYPYPTDPPSRPSYCEKRAIVQRQARKTNRKIDPFPLRTPVLWANTVRPNVPTNSNFLFYFFRLCDPPLKLLDFHHLLFFPSSFPRSVYVFEMEGR